MAEVKSLHVYSLYCNMYKRYANNKKVININANVSSMQWNNAKSYVTKICSDIRTSILNGHYSYHELKLFLFDMYARGHKVNWNDIKTKRILDTKKLYMKKQYANDKNFVIELQSNLGKDGQSFEDINDLFRINKDTSFVFDLIRKGHLHPIFYIKLVDFIDIDYTNESVDHKRFREIIYDFRQEINFW